MANRMLLNETAWFGRGAINALTDEAVRRGYRKALIVTDSTLARCGVAAKVTDKLDAAGLAWDIFSDVIPNPTIAVVQQGLQAFQRSGADYLIAIGGGSPQDTCKAIGIIQRNPEFADVRSLEGLSPTRQPSVPIFAVPTTAGTAAEVTINYVITDEEQRRKFVCVDPHDIPQVAFIDADMMDAMPPALKAATGVDALTHAIEGYLTRGALGFDRCSAPQGHRDHRRRAARLGCRRRRRGGSYGARPVCGGDGIFQRWAWPGTRYGASARRFTTRRTAWRMPSCCRT